ncbi:MAG TPA: TonB family protein [Thermoanaerobaculia bacterium]|jgi:TonB family protein
MTTDTLPRALGRYRLTAALGEDALGHEYRAVRLADGGFVRFRALDAAELDADAVIDAIEANGEVHEFLKNPAVARGVDMDAADGIPYIAWNEVNGRTLKSLLLKCRNPARKIPVEHALLIAEKIATALDHAYNTTIDGDRTLHGLVWPGFVEISDDGEIRLVGFGLASGVLPTLARPRLTGELANYVAPEERSERQIGKNSDVYSVGVILLELLTGQPPSTDPMAVLRGTGGHPPPPILPEIQAVLRMTLGPPESRYGSSGDLRRELGKLLFSGPYSPSTFNLAYFLNDLFKDEIEAETRARKRESVAGVLPATPVAPPRPPPPPRRPQEEEAQAGAAAPAPAPAPARSGSGRRTVLRVALGVAAAALAVAFVLLRRPAPVASPSLTAAPKGEAPAPTPTFLPEFLETPAAPTNGMTEGQFQEEVSRRLAVEVPKLEAQIQARAAAVPRAKRGAEAADTSTRRERTGSSPAPAASLPLSPVARALEPTAEPTSPPAATERAAIERAAAPTSPVVVPAAPAPAPTAAVLREGSLIALEDADSPPRIVKIVKPSYPPLALGARIGGIVVLRVLVSERGAPLTIEVIKGAAAGLTEAAVDAVRKWSFEPARKGGLAMRTWMVIPIPFEP